MACLMCGDPHCDDASFSLHAMLALPFSHGARYAAYTNLSWVLGDFIWTAIDYIGESAIGNAATSPDIQASTGQPWQWHVSFCGDIDIMGMQKPQAFYRARTHVHLCDRTCFVPMTIERVLCP